MMQSWLRPNRRGNQRQWKFLHSRTALSIPSIHFSVPALKSFQKRKTSKCKRGLIVRDVVTNGNGSERTSNREPTKTSGTMKVINDDARGLIRGPTEGHPSPGWEPEQEMLERRKQCNGSRACRWAQWGHWVWVTTSGGPLTPPLCEVNKQNWYLLQNKRTNNLHVYSTHEWRVYYKMIYVTIKMSFD